MLRNGLENSPQEIANLKGDEARAEFINTFKEIQRLKTQLEQYTDLKPQELEAIDKAMSNDRLRAFKSMYIETAKRLQTKRDKGADIPAEVEELDFEFVLFASTLIDYDYIMSLVSNYASSESKKQKMNKEQLINLLKSYSNLLDVS